MSHLLCIQSSTRAVDSVSRRLAERLVARIAASRPGATVVERDLAADPIAHFNADTFGAFALPADAQTPAMAQAFAVSEQAIAQLLAADTLVIAAPMHVFSVPSTLKSWLDNVVRIERTFRVTDQGPEGLLTGKTAYLVLSMGGVYSQGDWKRLDFFEPYLRAALGFMGIADITVICAERTAPAFGPDAADLAIAKAEAEIDALAL